jgi:hypothetical protein
MKNFAITLKDGSTMNVKCFARFSYEIKGQTFDFAVTNDATGLNKVLTHVGSGKRVGNLGGEGRFLGKYIKLSAEAYEAKGRMVLEALIDKVGEAKARSVIAAG